MAARHPADGAARWLVRAWTPVCGWHRDAVAATVADDPSVPALWAARGGVAADHPRVVEPVRRGLARWLEATPDGVWSGELGL